VRAVKNQSECGVRERRNQRGCEGEKRENSVRAEYGHVCGSGRIRVSVASEAWLWGNEGGARGMSNVMGDCHVMFRCF